jgi:DNA invertase Pin-like site-specific DNA recombinase
LLLTVLGGLAEFERELIRIRSESRSREQQLGSMGRPTNPTEREKVEARQRQAEGATLAKPALSFVVSERAFSATLPDPRS